MRKFLKLGIKCFLHTMHLKRLVWRKTLLIDLDYLFYQEFSWYKLEKEIELLKDSGFCGFLMWIFSSVYQDCSCASLVLPLSPIIFLIYHKHFTQLWVNIVSFGLSHISFPVKFTGLIFLWMWRPCPSCVTRHYSIYRLDHSYSQLRLLSGRITGSAIASIFVFIHIKKETRDLLFLKCGS